MMEAGHGDRAGDDGRQGMVTGHGDWRGLRITEIGYGYQER